MSNKSGRLATKVTRSQRTKRRLKEDGLLVHPADLGSLFAKRPLVLGEDESEYDELLSKVTTAIKPVDMIEALWAKDITDLAWDAQRLRRLKASLLTRAAQGALAEHLEAIPEAGVINRVAYSIPSLVGCYASGVKGAITHIDGILAKHGPDTDTMMSRALANWLAEVERIERMIAEIDARRNRVISDFKQYREGSARRSRMIGDDVMDVR